MVPTSTSLQPDFSIISGIRKDPPISTNSPLETGISNPCARVFNTSNNAAALLLTTVAASVPSNSQMSCSAWSSRSPRVPLCRSYSKLVGIDATWFIASMARRGSSARPRLVCKMVPVRLKIRLKVDLSASVSAVSTRATISFLLISQGNPCPKRVLK